MAGRRTDKTTLHLHDVASRQIEGKHIHDLALPPQSTDSAVSSHLSVLGGKLGTSSKEETVIQ